MCPVPHGHPLTPLLCLPVSLPCPPHFPQAPPAPTAAHTDPSPESPSFRGTAPAVHCHIPPDRAVSSLPLLPLHMNLPPQLQLFSGFSLAAPLYTNCLPCSCCFQLPLCFPGTQIGLPGFDSFQNPLVLSLGSSISPASAVFRLPSFALYTDTSPRFCCFQAPLFPWYTDHPPAYADPSCLRDSAGLGRVEGRSESERKGGERMLVGKLLL